MTEDSIIEVLGDSECMNRRKIGQFECKCARMKRNKNYHWSEKVVSGGGKARNRNRFE